MSNLPEGWDTYDPNDHERSTEPAYQAARDAAAQRAARRRGAYGEMLAALRRARSLTQVALAGQLGVAQGEVSGWSTKRTCCCPPLRVTSKPWAGT